MGVLYEMNWYLVASDRNNIKKLNINEYRLEKSDKRVYPIDCEIPFIIKNIGCIGIVKVNKFEIDKKNTNIVFSLVKELDVNNEIAKHYYEMYMNIKNS